MNAYGSSVTTRFAVGALLLIATSGCSRPYVKQYQSAIDTNHRNVSRIELGMTRQQLDDVMGKGETVFHDRIRLTNPWHTEAMKIRGNIRVEILYYVTQGYAWKAYFDTSTLVPVVLENDRVVGWGREFLTRNSGRYVLEQSGTAP